MIDHELLSRLFVKACDLPPADRARFLDDACRDQPDLRAELEAMLSEVDHSEDWTERVAAKLVRMARQSPPRTKPSCPGRVGPYQIVELLGEGGMGVVYRARQTEPIEREVALKIVRGGLASDVSRARFDAERRTLAAMEHPNIAHVLDAGTDDENRPYLVMELVRGAPINRYVESARPCIRDRLRLFLDVCRGVGHAHQRGIIHRDLKPSNVLVTVVNGKPVPKVIDFSIAKTLEDPILQTAFRTRTGQVVGTLEYMSPEQAAGRVNAVDTRCDVYSLGVLLYELLTDSLPIDLSGLSLPEAIRRIEEEPPRSLRGTSTSVSGRVDVDLQTILGKCLEKSPDRRYGSALELAGDIERYLDSRPILAQAPSVAYQLRKLVGRHRLMFGSAALLFAILLAFAVTVSIQLGIQSRERQRAETALARADRINAFLQDMLSSADPANRGAETTLREALDWSSRLAEAELGDEPELLAELLQTVGDAYRSLGDYDSSRAQLERALAIRRQRPGTGQVDLAATLESLSRTVLLAGDAENARRLAQESLAILRSLPPDDARIASALDALALSEHDLGDYEAAGRRASEALDLRRRVLGTGHRLTGESLITLSQVLLETDIVAAHERYDEGIQVLQAALGVGHPQVLKTISAVAPFMYKRLDDREEGIRTLSRVLEAMIPLYGADHLLVAEALSNRADLMTEAGVDLPAAERDTSRALEVFKQRLGRKHQLVGIGLNNLGFVRHSLNDLAGAEEAYREGVELALDITAPETEFVFLNLGILLAQQGRFEEAARMVEEGARRQMQYRPGRTGFALTARGLLLMEQGEYAEAEPVLRKLYEVASEDGPASKPGARLARNMLGRCLILQGRIDEGEPWLEEQRDAFLRTRGLPPFTRHELLRTAQLYERSGNDALAREYRDAVLRLDRAIRRPVVPIPDSPAEPARSVKRSGGA